MRLCAVYVQGLLSNVQRKNVETVATLVAVVRSQVETIEDRKRIAMRCTEQSDRLKKNANHKEALKELVTTMKGNWSFDRVHVAVGPGNAGPKAMPALPCIAVGEVVLRQRKSRTSASVSWLGFPTGKICGRK